MKGEEALSLTDEQKSKYVASEGRYCPYCGSNDIEGTGRGDSDGNWHSENIECNACEETWRDLYVLSEIIEDE